MKNSLTLFLLLTSNLLFAQFGQITNVQIIPANPSDIDQVKAVVEVMLGSSSCTLDNHAILITGSTIELQAYYCGGFLTTICNRIDTINLGTLAAGTYNLNINMLVGCSPYISVDSALGGFVVSVFSEINEVEKENKFSLFPNPSNNSFVNLRSNSTNPYSIVCYNSMGQQTFAMSNLTGNQIIYLPKENGFYFIKIIDAQNRISVLKCHRISG